MTFLKHNKKIIKISIGIAVFLVTLAVIFIPTSFEQTYALHNTEEIWCFTDSGQTSCISSADTPDSHLECIAINTSSSSCFQLEEEATYYLKRNDEDEAIYWHDSTTDIYNLIRAVTKPFPGAFSYLDNDPDSKIYIWRAIPFDNHLEWHESQTGEILEVFFDGSCVVNTGDSTLLVLENEGHQFSEGDVGRRFGNLNNSRKIWENIPL